MFIRRKRDRRQWKGSVHFPIFDSDNTLIPGDRRANGDRRQTDPRLVLNYGKDITELRPGGSTLLIGRSPRCNIVVDNEFASRRHIAITWSESGFTLKDRSTNGTYIHSAATVGTHVRAGTFPLSGAGLISPGAPVSVVDSVIYFEVTDAATATDDS